MTPTISYLVTTHNEGPIYLTPLINKLLTLKEEDDEIVILDDYSDDQKTIDFLASLGNKVKIVQHHLDKDFASHKNYGKSNCFKEIVMQIDGDELPHDNLVRCIKEIMLMNPGVEMLRVPRINLVQGLTEEDKNRWGWQVNEKGWINWPDYQDRVFLNVPEIGWVNKVHEKITGHVKHAELPAVEDYSLIHLKSIDRQRKQNEFYSTIN